MAQSQPAATLPLAQRLRTSLERRWQFLRNQRQGRRLTVVSQFYPPDFAATGQLLRDLCERLARRDLQVQVLTGMPSYAFNNPSAERLSFAPNLCIRRTRMSRIWPPASAAGP